MGADFDESGSEADGYIGYSREANKQKGRGAVHGSHAMLSSVSLGMAAGW